MNAQAGPAGNTPRCGGGNVHTEGVASPAVCGCLPPCGTGASDSSSATVRRCEAGWGTAEPRWDAAGQRSQHGGRTVHNSGRIAGCCVIRPDSGLPLRSVLSYERMRPWHRGAGGVRPGSAAAVRRQHGDRTVHNSGRIAGCRAIRPGGGVAPRSVLSYERMPPRHGGLRWGAIGQCGPATAARC